MARKRRPHSERLKAPDHEYASPEHGVLVLRGSLTAGTRRQYAEARRAGVREDAWQRAVEYLFERLTVRWTVGDVTYGRQRELLGRFRVASAQEREFVLRSLREHVAEHFPDVEAP
jgi:hypothetical protein